MIENKFSRMFLLKIESTSGFTYLYNLYYTNGKIHDPQCITGDNMLKVDEIGVPLSIARSIQIPETVRPYNRDRLNTYYMNKNKIYPGCSGIIKNGTKKLHNINYLDETYQMQDGDVIMRDMITGDVIGFNRQPSLLFSSMSSHKVIVLQKGETLRMNVSACNFYNADQKGLSCLIHMNQTASPI